MNKNVPILMTLLFITLGCYSQTATKTDYSKKAKNQKTAAWILLGAGAALDIAGIATTASNANKEFTFGSEIEPVNHSAEYALYIAGTACLAGSLTLFIASKKNKMKAAAVGFKNEIAPHLQTSTVTYLPVPSLSLKINL